MVTVHGPLPPASWRRHAASLAGTLLVAGVFAAPAAQKVADPAQALLTRQFGLTAADLQTLERRHAVVRTLPVTDSREVASLGVIKLDVPAAFYFDQLRDIATFKRHEAVRQLGVFGVPARASDIAALTLEAADVQHLRRCTPAACDIHLSADAITRMHGAVAWEAPDAIAQANQVFRQVVTDMTRAYQTSGDAALMTYVTKPPISMASEFKALVASEPGMLAQVPQLREHLTRFPQGTGGAEDVFYWSKEKVGPHMVVSVTHMAAVRLPPESAPAVYAVVSRQLYGSRLFEASLGLTLILEGSAADTQAYVVYVNRSRVDALSGFFGGLTRTIVRARARPSLSSMLEHTRAMVERRFAARRVTENGPRPPAP